MAGSMDVQGTNSRARSEAPLRLYPVLLDAALATAVAACGALRFGVVWCGPFVSEAYYGAPLPWIQKGVLTEDGTVYPLLLLFDVAAVAVVVGALLWASADHLVGRAGASLRLGALLVCLVTMVGLATKPITMVGMGYWRVRLVPELPERIVGVRPWLDGRIYFADPRCPTQNPG